jgi:hypothetical protein
LLQPRVARDLSGQVGYRAHSFEQLVGGDAELVDDRRVELLALARSGQLDSRVGAAVLVEHLNVVSEVEQPDGTIDVGAADARGHPGPIPAGKDLLQRVAHLVPETESLRHLRGGQAMRHEPAFDGLAPRDDECAGETEPVQRRASESHMAQGEPLHWQAGKVDVVAVAPEGDVVAEPRRKFGCVGYTSDPRQHHDVVQGRSRFVFDSHAFAEASRDHPRAQHVLHRLAQPEIGCQREGGDKFRQAHPGVPVIG